MGNDDDGGQKIIFIIMLTRFSWRVENIKGAICQGGEQPKGVGRAHLNMAAMLYAPSKAIKEYEKRWGERFPSTHSFFSYFFLPKNGEMVW